ncbi:MAG: DUF393 domain-containing protein [Planctomycetes bacterium]|nr:DUF393 domain-containing protein [Planctomycetota bacterium]
MTPTEPGTTPADSSPPERSPGELARSRPVLIYDGRCRFCVGQAARLARWLKGRVNLQSFRDPGVLEHYPRLTAAACERAMQLVLPDGRIFAGAEAVSHALRLRAALAPIGWLYLVPGVRQLMDWGYDLVARNRFRLQGEVCTDDACRTHQRDPPPGRACVRDLFLRALGMIFVIAFLSLAVQSTLLWGREGLLPARQYRTVQKRVTSAAGVDAKPPVAPGSVTNHCTKNVRPAS